VLVISCRPGEKVVLVGRDVTVEVVAVLSNRVRIGVEAPREVPVVRAEVRDPSVSVPGPQPDPA
jgi:carbon storage regulator